MSRVQTVDQACRELASAAARYAFVAVATDQECDWSAVLERLRQVENVVATAIAHAEHATHESDPKRGVGPS